MTEPQSWVKRIFGERKDMLTLISPEVVRERSLLARIVVGGATIAGIAGAALIGVFGVVALMFAIAAIYFLATQVLGIQVNVDPQAIYQQFQKQAQTYGAN